MEYNLSIEDILVDYFSTFDIQPFTASICITDNISKIYSELRPDHIDKNNQMMQYIEDYSGTIVAPAVFTDKFTILIDKKYMSESINKNFDWIGTIVHEFTHVGDFMEYAMMVGTENYDDILDITKHRMFILWTEFNAKAKGYYFVRKYSFKDMRDEEQISYISETEIPDQIDYMSNECGNTENADRQLYVVVHFLARLYILEELFPKYFNKTVIGEMFESNVWILELYEFLKTHTNLKDAYSDFDFMREILRKNFSGI